MPRLRPLLHDLRRIAEGCVAFLEYLLTKDRVEIGLGQWSAETPVARQGDPNRYGVTISNLRGDRADVTVAIDIYAVDDPVHPGGHYAHFGKRLSVRPRASVHARIEYDWRTRARFIVGDTAWPPDHFWRGTLDRLGTYSIHAVLLDARGTRLESLGVYQELKL
ncbi:MAG: hypothetical protein DMD81_02790 [Candidatus Rokuibacteriota bacterium]|nr:MAG: hypothetical protein DMD81_02790 [Candidatus Rokubacteria bacterium]